MNEDNSEFNLEPVEIHPEQYATNLFGEKTASPSEIVDSFTLSAGAPTESKSHLAAPFNIFALTDAIGARKKRDAWVLYQKALAQGLLPEDVFFRVLIWQVKSMLLASKTKGVSETDMKPFPYNKAKGFSKNFKDGEIEKLSEDLILGYHK